MLLLDYVNTYLHTLYMYSAAFWNSSGTCGRKVLSKSMQMWVWRSWVHTCTFLKVDSSPRPEGKKSCQNWIKVTKSEQNNYIDEALITNTSSFLAVKYTKEDPGYLTKTFLTRSSWITFEFFRTFFLLVNQKKVKL